MTFTLSDQARSAGYRLAAFDTIGSTSPEALARAKAGDSGPLWIVSAHQSAGQGRHGSAWHTPKGNLAASLLLTTDLPTATLATLGFVAGVALAQALDRVCVLRDKPLSAPQRHAGRGSDDVRHREEARRSVLNQPPPIRFSLKWPNDVLVDGAKLAGILLGTEELESGRRAVVIGIGVNVATAPRELPYPVTSLQTLGCATEADRVFEALSGTWLEVERLWDHGRGFATIRELWLERAAGLGGAVAVQTGTAAKCGTFETIDEQGQLVIRSGDGATHRVSAGEVHFGAAASATPEARV